MTTDFAPTSPAMRFLGLIQPAVQVALIEVIAFVRLSHDQHPIYEPDRWSFEAPFSGAEWPRS